MSLEGDIEAKPVAGIVHLSEESEDVLIDMEFLREFEIGLKVFRDKVCLVPEPSPEIQP